MFTVSKEVIEYEPPRGGLQPRGVLSTVLTDGQRVHRFKANGFKQKMAALSQAEARAIRMNKQYGARAKPVQRKS